MFMGVAGDHGLYTSPETKHTPGSLTKEPISWSPPPAGMFGFCAAQVLDLSLFAPETGRKFEADQDCAPALRSMVNFKP